MSLLKKILIHVLIIAVFILFYAMLKSCIRSSSPFISSRSFLTHKTLMMLHMRSGSKDQLTFPQGVFSLGIFFPLKLFWNIFFAFLFLFSQRVFCSCWTYFHKSIFLLGKKEDQGELGFWLWWCVVLVFFPFQFPLIWKIITWWKKARKGFVYSSNNKACPIHCSSGK